MSRMKHRSTQRFKIHSTSGPSLSTIAPGRKTISNGVTIAVNASETSITRSQYGIRGELRGSIR